MRTETISLANRQIQGLLYTKARDSLTHLSWIPTDKLHGQLKYLPPYYMIYYKNKHHHKRLYLHNVSYLNYQSTNNTSI